MAIYDIGEQRVDGQQQPIRYIAMELVDGKTLRELTTSGPLDIKRTLKLMLQVAEALTAAHAAGGYAKVLDFGLASFGERASRPQSASVPLGDHGNRARRPVTAGETPALRRENRRTPSAAFSTSDTLHKVIYTEPEPIRSVRPDVPSELVRILRKALAKDPDERYQTMKDLAIDLRELLREVDSSSSFSGAPPAAAAPVVGQRRRRLWPGLVALAIVVAGMIAIFSLRKPAATATPAATMRINRVTASGKVIAAAISQDGKFANYVVSDQGEQSLWVRQMTSGQSLQLIPPAREAYWGTSFAPDGSIYYGQKSPSAPSGAIYQISALGGTPRKIISEIDSQPAFSPDGKQMVFLRARFPTESESTVMVANADGSGARALASVSAPEMFVPVFFAGASWSPDGKLIAASINNRRAFEGRIVSIDVASGRMNPIAAAGWRQVAQVAWMPDQKSLIAIAVRANESNSGVWQVAYPEGVATPLTNDLFDYRAVSVTSDGKSIMTVAADISADIWIHPDGATAKRMTGGKMEGAFGVDHLADGRIVFTSLETGKLDIWIMNGDGSGKVLLTRDPHENRAPVVSPDGKLVVYVSATSKQTELCRMNIDGSDRRVLSIGTPTTLPDVSPDGRQVIFETSDLTSPSRKNVVKLARVPMAGGPTVFLTDYLSWGPAYSPDGSQIAMYVQETPEAPFGLCILDANDGRIVKRLQMAPPFFASRIRWSSDGRSLYVNTAPSDRANLWQVPLDDSAPKRLTQFDEHTLFWFAPLRTGKGWVFSRGDLSRDAVLITGIR